MEEMPEFKQKSSFNELVKQVADILQELKKVSEETRTFTEGKGKRDEQRLKEIQNTIDVLPMELAEHQTLEALTKASIGENVEFVYVVTKFLDKVSKMLTAFLENPLFHQEYTFAREDVLERVALMEKILWHVYSRGPVPRSTVKGLAAPYSDEMFNDIIEILKATGQIAEMQKESAGGGVESQLVFAEGRAEYSLIDRYLWSYKTLNRVNITEEKKKELIICLNDFYNVDSSAVYASIIAEILDGQKEGLPASVVTSRFNSKFKGGPGEKGRGIKKSEDRIKAVLEWMLGMGFVSKGKKGGEETWTLNQGAYDDPVFHKLKTGDEKGREMKEELKKKEQAIGELIKEADKKIKALDERLASIGEDMN
jgi:hypothetical protein